MTRMLASVADAAEASVGVQFGADVIDLKDARRGALGAVSLDIARQAVAAVAGRCETSAALGDPPYDEDALVAAARALAAIGVDTLKLAVDAPTLDRLGNSLMRLAREVALVGMMFADEQPDFALLAKLKELSFKGAMLDTRDKNSRPASRASRGRSAQPILLAVPRAQANERPRWIARSARRSATVACAPRCPWISRRALSCARPARRDRPGRRRPHPRSHPARENGPRRFAENRLAAAGARPHRRTGPRRGTRPRVRA